MKIMVLSSFTNQILTKIWNCAWIILLRKRILQFFVTNNVSLMSEIYFLDIKIMCWSCKEIHVHLYIMILTFDLNMVWGSLQLYCLILNLLMAMIACNYIYFFNFSGLDWNYFYHKYHEIYQIRVLVRKVCSIAFFCQNIMKI